MRGSITCFEDLIAGRRASRLYFTQICNSRNSDDHFKPQHFALEVLASRAVPRLPFVPYGGIGVLREKTIFDIGVLRTDGSRDPDHPILELRATRPYGFLGGTVNTWRSTRLTGELLYSPGSLFTLGVAGFPFTESGDGAEPGRARARGRALALAASVTGSRSLGCATSIDGRSDFGLPDLRSRTIVRERHPPICTALRDRLAPPSTRTRPVGVAARSRDIAREHASYSTRCGRVGLAIRELVARAHERSRRCRAPQYYRCRSRSPLTDNQSRLS